MPTARSLIAGLVLGLTVISCSEDNSPTAPTNPTTPTTPSDQTPAPKVAGRAALLTEMHVKGRLFTEAGAFTNQIVRGKVTIKHLRFNRTTQTLEASGVFRYKNPATGANVTQRFINVPARLVNRSAPTQPTCQILVLDLGPLHLDLLGLVVNLAPVHLDIHGETGPGNLLGNLLCALANLLNGPNVSGVLGAITNLLGRINAILAGV